MSEAFPQAARGRDGDVRPNRDGSRARREVIFLDKDGTLIEDLPYNVDPRRIRLAPGAREAIRLLASAGHRFVIVTNQSGVARGYFTQADLGRVHAHLEWLVEDLGGTLLGFYACPHLPEGINEYAIDCECRKPLPGLIRQAARELDIDVERSWFVGDTWMDAAAGRAAGCRTIIVGPDAVGAEHLPPDRRPDHATRDLLGAARIILAAEGEATVATEGASGGAVLAGAGSPVAGGRDVATSREDAA